MRRRTILIGLSVGAPVWSQFLAIPCAHAGDGEVAFSIPLRLETPGDVVVRSGAVPEGQVGKAIVLKDLSKADPQISDLLVRGLQAMGLVIETPPLKLETFIEPRQEWRTRVTQIGPETIAAHNRASNGPRLRSDRIYAIQYKGSYLYDGPMLRMVLAITLFERSALGVLRRSGEPYSVRFFADALEHSILAQSAGPGARR